jgi:hypothetical protein
MLPCVLLLALAAAPPPAPDAWEAWSYKGRDVVYVSGKVNAPGDCRVSLVEEADAFGRLSLRVRFTRYKSSDFEDFGRRWKSARYRGKRRPLKQVVITYPDGTQLLLRAEDLEPE